MKVSGIWMQDWVGQHEFPEGTRLLWNWVLNRQQYPGWDKMVDEWKQDGVRPVVYLNPYLADTNDFGVHSDLYQEGLENDYFVKNRQGEVYYIYSVSIRIVMIDLTNPAARKWCKEKIIKRHVIEEARAGGWMHDFGEYLPFDAVLFDGSDPVEYHTRYVEDWAQIAQEAIDETDSSLYYYMRAGTATSP